MCPIVESYFSFKIKLKRLHEFLVFDKSIKHIEENDDDKISHNELKKNVKKRRISERYINFLNEVIDTQNGLYENRLLHNNPALIDSKRYNQLLVSRVFW